MQFIHVRHRAGIAHSNEIFSTNARNCALVVVTIQDHELFSIPPDNGEDQDSTVM